MSGSRGPLGFGDESERTPPPRDDPRSEDEPWLPGDPAGSDEGPGRAASRLPGIALLTAGFILLAIVGLNTLRTEGGSSTGLGAGEQIPPFAAPLALSDVVGDVNLARKADQGGAGSRPAWAITDPGVLTSCALVRGRPVVIAFFVPGDERCIRQLDVLARVLQAKPGVRGAAIAVRGDREDLRELARSRKWPFPVAHDRDGGLANVYGVAVCPQLTFVLPGGEVEASTVGELGRQALERRVDRLVTEARKASAPAPPAGGQGS